MTKDNPNFLGELVAAGVTDAHEALAAVYVVATDDMSSFLATMARLRFLEASLCQSACAVLKMDLERAKLLLDGVQLATSSSMCAAKMFTDEEMSTLYPNYTKMSENSQLRKEEILKAADDLNTSITKLHS